MSHGRDPSVVVGPREERTLVAAILRVLPFREHDLMAHLLTPECGKISAIARHARGSRKRFPAALDLFDRGRATIGAEKSGAVALKGFLPTHTLTGLRKDLDKLTLASLISELFDVVIPNDDSTGGQEYFELFDLTLNAINESPDLATALRTTCIGASQLGSYAGYTDPGDTPPSGKVLMTAIEAAEQFSQRRLMTKRMVLELIGRFGDSRRNGLVNP